MAEWFTSGDFHIVPLLRSDELFRSQARKIWRLSISIKRLKAFQLGRLDGNSNLCRLERALRSCFKQKQFGWILGVAFGKRYAMKNLPECDLSHNGTDKINGKIVEMMEYLNSELGNRLLERKKEGLCLRVRHATHFDVGSFQPEHSKCHDNVDRWCLEHRDHKPMRGWLLTGSIFFDRTQSSISAMVNCWT
jgi:hypothetical protein